MRRKEEIVLEEPRSLKHVIFGTFFFAILISLFGIFLWETKLKNIKPSTQTLGASISGKSLGSPADLPDKKDVNKILQGIQGEINSLTPESVASSDSAILKIIGDLERLRKGDASTVETVCNLLCK